MNQFADHVLIASCLGDGDTGGGLFALDNSNDTEMKCIDRLSSTGLNWFKTAAGENRVLRIAWCPESLGHAADLIEYDNRGALRYFRLDNVCDVHDVAWDGSNFVLVSSGTDEVVWLDPSGEIVKVRSVSNKRKDCCHLNCLLFHEGRILVSAFGRFESHRGWKGRDDKKEGVVVDLDTGENVLTELCCPHNPRVASPSMSDSTWLICNSAMNELLEIEPDGRTVRRRVQLEAWTRGIALTPDVIYVGESAPRQRAAGVRATATVAVVCRKTFKVLRRISLPCREIYDLLLVPPALADGLRIGFHTNPLRVSEKAEVSLEHSEFSGNHVQKLAAVVKRIGLAAQRETTFRQSILARDAEFDGSLDRVDDSAIAGWAWDEKHPKVRLSLELLVDGKCVDRILADEFRADLLDAGKGDGCCAFNFFTPETLKDGRTHGVEVKVSGSDFSLGGGPVRVCLALAFKT